MSTRQVAKARSICYDCPVRRDCLAFALTQPEDWGIWGGLTSAERKRALALAKDTLSKLETLRPTYLEVVAAVIAIYDDGDLEGQVVKR